MLVVGCDLITDLNLNNVLHLFHKNDATVTMLLSTVKENQDLPVPGAKSKADKGTHSLELENYT